MNRYPEPRSARYGAPVEQRDTTGLYEALPHASGFPPARDSASAVPAPLPVYDRHGGYEAFNVNAAAGSAFIEACRFSGLPDSVIFSTSGADLDVRFRRRGGPPGDTIKVTLATRGDVLCTGEIVEFRDPAGAGGIELRIIGRYSRPDGAPRRALGPNSVRDQA